MASPLVWLERKEASVRAWESAHPGGERKSYFRIFTALFVLVVCCLLLAYLLNGREPIWYTDGLEQYLPLFLYEGDWLRSVISGIFTGNMPDSFLWSWAAGYGSDTLATFDVFWDPLNLLSALVPQRYGEFMFIFLIVVRMYLAGVFFSLYALYRKNGRFATLCGALVYSFSGPALIGTFWPGGIVPLVLFPLLLLGVEKLFAHDSPATYVIAVALFFIITYYFSWTACILLFFYCTVRAFQVEDHMTVRKFFGWVAKFLLYLLLGVVISAVAFLPGVIQILSDTRATNAIATVPLFYSLSYYLAMPGAFIAPYNAGSDCFTGFSSIAFAAVVMLFSKRRENTPLKWTVIVFAICLLLPAAGSLFNGFNYATNRWLWAYAFCLSYVVTLMMPRFEKATGHEQAILVFATVIYGVVLMVFSGSNTEAVMAEFATLGTLLAAIVYACHKHAATTTSAVVSNSASANADAATIEGAATEPEKKRKRMRHTHHASPTSMARFALAGAVVAAVVVNATYFGNGQESAFARKSIPIGSGYTQIVDENPDGAITQVDDDGLWRFDGEPAHASWWKRLRNACLVLGANSINFYNSIYNDSIDQYHTELAIAGDDINFSYINLNGAARLEALAGVKYYVTPGTEQSSPPSNFAGDDNIVATSKSYDLPVEVHEAKYTLPIGFAFDKEISRSDYLEMTPLQRQEALIAGVVVDDETAESDDVDTTTPTFTSQTVDSQITASDGVTVEDGQIIASKANATLTLSVEGLPDSETYLSFTNLQYLGQTSEELSGAAEDESLPWYRRIAAASKSWTYSKPDNYTITAQSDNGGASRCITNSSETYHMYGGKSNWALNMGYSENACTTVTITFSQAGHYTFDSMEIDCLPTGDLEQQITELNEDALQDTQVVCDGLTGSIDLDEKKYLYFSIPYSEGWSATVDGEPVEIVKADTAFMAIELDAGHHDFELHYFTPGLAEGAIITVVGIAVFAVVLVVWRRRHPRKQSAHAAKAASKRKARKL